MRCRLGGKVLQHRHRRGKLRRFNGPTGHAETPHRSSQISNQAGGQVGASITAPDYNGTPGTAISRRGEERLLNISPQSRWGRPVRSRDEASSHDVVSHNGGRRPNREQEQLDAAISPRRCDARPEPGITPARQRAVGPIT